MFREKPHHIYVVLVKLYFLLVVQGGGTIEPETLVELRKVSQTVMPKLGLQV